MLADLKKMKRAKVEGLEFDVKENRYQIPLILSSIFWLLLMLGTSFKLPKKQLAVIFLFGLVSFTSTAQEWRDSLEVARTAYKNGEFEKALGYYESAQQKAPEDIDLSDEIGQSAYKAHQYKRAEEIYKQKSASEVVDSKKKAADYHNLGNAKMKNKDYQGAIDAYKESLRNNPNDEETRYNLSEAMRQLQNQQKKKNNQNNNQNNQQQQQQNQQQQNQQQQNNQQNQQQSNQQQSSQQNQQQQSGNGSPQLKNKSVEKKLDELMKQESKTKRKLGGRKYGQTQPKSGKDW